MKKFINYLLVLCLIVPCFFVLTACDNGNVPASIVGTYSNTYVDLDYAAQNTISLDIRNDGSFTYSISQSSGIADSYLAIDGKIVFDENKQVEDVQINNLIDGIAGAKESILGNILPKQLLDMGPDEYYQMMMFQNMFGDILKECLYFGNDYLVLTFGTSSSYQVLYKSTAKKFAENDFITFFTEKDYYDLRNSMYVAMNRKVVTYKTDYYFIKNSFDLTDATAKADFIETLNSESEILVANKYGHGRIDDADIKDIEDFDLTTAGEKVGTIKLQINNANITVRVTYTVVEDKSCLPSNQIEEIKVINDSSSSFDIDYIAKDTDIYSLGWQLLYETFSSSSKNYVDLDETNCTGDEKIVTITGYDKTKTGFQLVTFEYLGEKISQAVFVYDETVNPVIDISYITDAKVVITKTTVDTQTTYSIDYTNAKINLIKADGSEVEQRLTANETFELQDLSSYKNFDYIYFAYNYKFGGKTFTFYVEIEVEVVEA